MTRPKTVGRTAQGSVQKQPRGESPVNSETSCPYRAALDQIRAFDPDGSRGALVRILDLYLSESTTALSELGQAIQKRSAEAVRELAHKLKSPSFQLGAVRLANLCQELESLAASTVSDESAQVYAELQREHEVVVQILRAEIQRDS